LRKKKNCWQAEKERRIKKEIKTSIVSGLQSPKGDP
jgi:hypothetical protein